MFRTEIVKLCLIPKLVCKRQWRRDAKLFLETPLSGDTVGFPLSWMAAAGVRPITRPKGLLLTASLQQHFTL